MDWFKKHIDAISIIGSMITGTIVILTSIHNVDVKLCDKINDVNNDLSREIALVNNEIIKIQTVLIIKGIVPTDLFASDCEK